MSDLEWLFVARDNNYGLTRDVALLIDAIRRNGGSAEFAACRSRSIWARLKRRKIAERVVHVERVFPGWLNAGEMNFLIPNQERFPARHIGRLKRIDSVLAKTRHAESIFADLGLTTKHIGFTSQDRYDPSVPKDWQRFFHLAGGSTLKGTETILDLWKRHPEWPELVLVQKADNAPESVPPNIRLFSGYLNDDELRRLQNACGIHLCPSLSEGWGHHIVEGLSVGAVVVTTDGPPMNEHVDEMCGVCVPFIKSEPRHLGTNFYVDPQALEAEINALLLMNDAEKLRKSAAARERYLSIADKFDAQILELVGRDKEDHSSPIATTPLSLT